MLTLATRWQSGSSVAQWLSTLANTWLLESQFCKGCGGVEGVEGGESNGVCGREQCCTVAANIGKHLAFEKSVLQRLWREWRGEN